MLSKFYKFLWIIIYIYLSSSFRKNFHSAVCLFSKYFQHFLSGENLYELDATHYKVKENVFNPNYNLSSNWKGTCKLIENFNNFRINYLNTFSALDSSVNTNTYSSQYYSQLTREKIESLTISSSITSPHPSGSSSTIILNFEKEFNNLSDNTTLGGLIYNEYTSRLQVGVNEIETIKTNVKNYILNNNL